MEELSSARVSSSADVDDRASIGAGTLVWDLVQVRESASRRPVRHRAWCLHRPRRGRGRPVQDPESCAGLRAGSPGRRRVHRPGRGADERPVPPAVTPTGELKSADDWDAVGVVVNEGASIGARSVCIAPITIGRWAMIAAGSVVTKDVPDHALVVGVPARRVGWVGRAGVPLDDLGDGTFRCPRTAQTYAVVDDQLAEISGP